MPHSFPTRLSSALHLALGRSRGGAGIGIGAADHLFDFGRQFGGGIAGLFQRDLHGAAAAQFAAAHAEDAVGTAAIGRQLGGGGADLVDRNLGRGGVEVVQDVVVELGEADRKSTRLNSSHSCASRM